MKHIDFGSDEAAELALRSDLTDRDFDGVKPTGKRGEYLLADVRAIVAALGERAEEPPAPIHHHTETTPMPKAKQQQEDEDRFFGSEARMEIRANALKRLEDLQGAEESANTTTQAPKKGAE